MHAPPSEKQRNKVGKKYSANFTPERWRVVRAQTNELKRRKEESETDQFAFFSTSITCSRSRFLHMLKVLHIVAHSISGALASTDENM